MNLTRPNSSSSSTKPFIPITPIVLFVCFSVCQFTPSRVAAGVVIDIAQIGGNVVATGGGTLDLAGLTFFQHGNTPNSPGINPYFGYLFTGPLAKVDVYTGFAGTAGWGSDVYTPPSTVGGNVFVMFASVNQMGIPEGYTSGEPLNTSATWDSATFSSLGLNPGTYTYTWGFGSTADSLTVQVGASSVPEPATIWLLAMGAAAAFAVHARFARSKHQRREGLQCPEAETE
jgi:hypothetical protein